MLLRIACGLGACFLAFTAGAQKIRSTGTDVPGMGSYDEFAAWLMGKYEIPGGAIAVARDGRLVFARGYGQVDKATEAPVQPESAFRIASLSKPITAAAILLLVQRGKLSLDQPVLSIIELPDGVTPADSRLASVTIRHLLQHSGGWDSTTFDPMFEPFVIANATGTSPPPDRATIIRYMIGKRLDFDPGTKHQYSNFGYALLGRVIEVVTGQTYEQFVREEVLAFSGAACMRVGKSLASQALPNEVRYYDYQGAPQTPSVYGTGASVPRPDGGFSLEAMDSHGGWVGSTVDYLRFMLSVDDRADHADLLSASTISDMTARPSIPEWSGKLAWYGMGWEIRPSGADANWWHTGKLPGTATIAVRNYEGVTWAAFFNFLPKNDGDFLRDLDNGMWQARSRVTVWPSNDQFPAFRGCFNPGQRRRGVRH